MPTKHTKSTKGVNEGYWFMVLFDVGSATQMADKCLLASGELDVHLLQVISSVRFTRWLSSGLAAPAARDSPEH